GPKGNLWMWMLTPPSLYILRSCAHLASCDSRSLARSPLLSGGGGVFSASLPFPRPRPPPPPVMPANERIGPSINSVSLRPSFKRQSSVYSAVVGVFGPPR